MGQLQKYAGSDQRVTGTADLAGAADGSRLENGNAPANTQSVSAPTNGLAHDNGLTAVQAGTRHWTGVWGNADPTGPALNNGNSYEKTPSPKLLGWLVSGNEAARFNTSTQAANFGQVIAENSGIDFAPADITTGISAHTHTHTHTI